MIVDTWWMTHRQLRALLRQPAVLDLDMRRADRTLQHLQRRVVGPGELLHDDGHIGEVARHLQARVERQDRLGGDSRA